MRHRDKVYAQYDKTLERRGIYRSMSKNPSRLSKPWLPKNKSAAILDFGCGFGKMLSCFWATGYTNLTGLDSAEVQIKKAKEFLPSQIQVHLGDGLGFLNSHTNQYDLICTLDVMEHLTKDEAIEVTAAFFSALRPGGTLVVNVPNMGAFSGLFYRYICLDHLAGYTDLSLFQLFDTAGFVDHQLLERDASINLRLWRPWKPLTGFGLRPRLNTALHRLVYWLGGTPPPNCFETKLEAWTRKPYSDEEQE